MSNKDAQTGGGSFSTGSISRIIGGLLLAAAISLLLPGNRDGVVNQQVIQVLPELVEGWDDRPWILSPTDDSAIQKGVSEADSRRAPGERSGPTVTLTVQRQRDQLLVATSTQLDGQAVTRNDLKPIPNTWGLFPPLAAIFVAILSGRLIVGLCVAVLAGGVLAVVPVLPVYQVPTAALYKAIVIYVWGPLQSSFQLYILAFTAALIGMVRVTSLAGGNLGIANVLASRAEGARSTRVAAFLMGLAIFFDDYANTIVVGTTLRPIADRFRVSREKLAYLVDSTAAPIAGVAVISTWIGYEVGLFDDLMRQLKTGISGYQLFFSALSARFYCLLTLTFVGLSTWLRRDFGPMLRAERRAQDTGQVIRPGSTPLTGSRLREVVPAEGVIPAWWAAALPVFLVVSGVIIGMALDTADHPQVSRIRAEQSILSSDFWTACFSNADNARVLFTASILGSVAAILIAATRRHAQTGRFAISPVQAAKTWVFGITGVYYAIAILILAWAIKEVCTDLGTSTYLTAALSPIISPGLLPLLIFLLASVVAFSIGTSWTTMAILIPTVVPLAHAMGGLPLTILAAAAVLDGAIFGDHCSPISDTTVMASIASSCDHIDHVKTQMPYALATMGIAAVFGYLGAANLYPASVGLILGVGAVIGLLLIIGRNPDERPNATG